MSKLNHQLSGPISAAKDALAVAQSQLANYHQHEGNLGADYQRLRDQIKALEADLRALEEAVQEVSDKE